MPADCEPTALPSELHPRIYIWSYGVVVSISGCDPLDPGSTPGTAIFDNFSFVEFQAVI